MWKGFRAARAAGRSLHARGGQPAPVTETAAAALSPPLSAQRIPELDAIRGLAALVVVLFHCWKTLPWPEYGPYGAPPLDASGLMPYEWLFRYTPLRIVTAGTASVGVFFILSGLVLALPMVRGRVDGYGSFLLKRFFRLYPPFAAAIALSCVLCAALDPGAVAGLSGWFNHSWDEPLRPGLVAAHLLMLGPDPYLHLDNVMWSLVHEVRISLLFPLLVLAVMRRPAPMLAAAALVLGVVSYSGVFLWMRHQLDVVGPWWPLATLLDTARYLLYFVAGILLALRLNGLVEALRRSGPALRGLAWCLGLGLLLTRFGPFGDAAWALGAALLILLCLGSARARALLRAAPLQWLGKVSYSLYLVHLPLLLALMHMFADSPRRLYALAALPPLALLAAGLFYRCVEAPSQRLGRRLLQRPVVAADLPTPA